MPELDEKKRIIEYDTVNDPDENYYALIDNGTAGTGKVSIKGLGPADMISDEYDATSTYKVGDVCIHNNKLYVCNTDIDTPHAFDLSEWDLDTIGNYVSEIKSSLSDYLPKNVSGVGNLRILGAKDIYPQFTNGEAQLVTTDYVPLADLNKIIAVIPFGVGARLLCALTSNRGQVALTAYGSTYTGNAISVTMLFILAD